MRGAVLQLTVRRNRLNFVYVPIFRWFFAFYIISHVRYMLSYSEIIGGIAEHVRRATGRAVPAYDLPAVRKLEDRRLRHQQDSVRAVRRLAAGHPAVERDQALGLRAVEEVGFFRFRK